MHYSNLNGCNFKNALEYIPKFGLVLKETRSNEKVHTVNLILYYIFILFYMK